MAKKISLLLMLTLTISACSKGGDGGSSGEVTAPTVTETNNSNEDSPTTPEEPAKPTPPVTPPTSTLPSAALTFDANIDFVNVTSTQEAKFEKAIEIIKEVVATEEFRKRVLNHTYNGKKTYVDNGGFTNAQIYQKILEGAEKLFPAKNNAMDMEVELYYTASNTVGYTYPNSKRIWVNRKYFNIYTAAGVAHNLFHEWLHKLGFTHSASYSTSRNYSVPYALGTIMNDLGKNFL